MSGHDTALTGVTYASLAGKRVIVTGGATGIGAAIVGAFAGQGCTVDFLDIQDEAGAALAAQHDRTIFHHCDLTDIPALRATLAAIEAQGGTDVLVNNAAHDDRHEMASVEPDYWRGRLAVNLDHQFFATQAIAKGMQQRGQGSIILFSSTSWMKGRPGMVAYTTAKAAIAGMNRTLARELGPFGVRVNCILPGAIVTERQLRLWHTPEVEAEFMTAQALKLRLAPEHVAAMTLFLASDQAAGCTGANFIVDAGLT